MTIPEAINPRFPVLWHGGDYNPDQWPPEVVDEDVRLFTQAGINVATVGVFSWSQIEVEDDRYDWDWLDRVFDKLHAAGIRVALATPSASPPRWLTQKHPDILSIAHDHRRLPHGGRQRFCPTLPAYRFHVDRVNAALARRYAAHPALVLWHISNEYIPTCHCPLCASAFRAWLQKRYGELDTLNQQYNAAFWSHRFTDWRQIDPPFDNTTRCWQPLQLDWQRFKSHAVCEFFKFEIDSVRRATPAAAPSVPFTTNLMGTFRDLDYTHFADVMDVISWDSYPQTGGGSGAASEGVGTAFGHALMRGIKGQKPWLLLECTPSATNWQPTFTLKPPGLLRLWSWQAVAHGSDSVMYFQLRRGRGGPEKWHGAVIDHQNSDRPRTFKEVSQVGDDLRRLSERVVGTTVAPARVGVLWDQECRWALENSFGPGRQKDYVAALRKHFAAVWSGNIAVNLLRVDADWSGYRMILAPALYLVRTGRFPLDGSAEELRQRLDLAAKIERFVEGGGTFVTTVLSGLVNESDQVFMGGYPGPLRRVTGVWVEETDNFITPDRPRGAPALDGSAQHPGRPSGGEGGGGGGGNRMVMEPAAIATLGSLKTAYGCDTYYDLLHAESAQVLARYGENWYAGRPCLTVNRLGAGRCYYLASDPSPEFLGDFYAALAADLGIEPTVQADRGVEVLERHALPASVPDHARPGASVPDRLSPVPARRLLFLLNHAAEARQVDLGPLTGTDLLTGREMSGHLILERFGVRVIEVA